MQKYTVQKSRCIPVNRRVVGLISIGGVIHSSITDIPTQLCIDFITRD